MGFFSGAAGAIAGAIGGVASTILGNNSAKHEAQVNRDWQEDMSNTSVQRRVEDLKAAGLNPLLAVSSASSGASTPTGAQAQLKHFDPTVITNLMNGLATAKLTKEQAEAQANENELYGAKKEALEIQNDLMKQKVWTEQVERDLKVAQTDAEREKILTEAYRRRGIKVSTEKVVREAQILGIELDLLQNGPYGDNLGANAKFRADNNRGFFQSIGFGLGLNSARSVKNDKFNGFRGISKKYIPRQIDERRISR